MFAVFLRIRNQAWFGYGIAVLTCFIGLWLRFALAKFVAPAPFLTFFPAVAITALVGGTGPGLLTVAFSAGLADYFFMPPTGFSLPLGGVTMLLTYIAVATIIVALSNIAMRANAKLRCAQTALQTANETLEARVAARTAELMHTEEQLRQAQKMEAIGQLTGGIAHDFNNLLAGICGSLDMLQTRLAQGRVEELPRHIATAREAASRAATLTHRLLAFARQQPLAPHSTNINALAASMADLVIHTIPARIELAVNLAPGLHATLVDPNQLEHALLNLCINAADAMPLGGQLNITTANATLNTAAAAALDLPDGDYVTLPVADTGNGMPPDVLARAFDPFFTTKPPGEGTGLGLSMIYGFARQSGGHAAIRSSPGRGTQVTLYLPRHHGPAEPLSPPIAPPLPNASGTGETILVVDDEPSVRQIAVEVLQDCGYNIFQAASGADALDILRTTPSIGLLVSDLGLPDMSGQDLATTARALRPELKLLFITGYAEAAASRGAPLAPGTRVLSKPFSLAELPLLAAALLSGQESPPVLGESPSSL